MVGAKFLRADLHIHSFGDGGSYDVTDCSQTPQGIVDIAIQKGINIISITDHNEILNSNIAIQYAEGKDILVIPGVEVSTTQGHLLLYFATFKNLQVFFGKLSISADRTICHQGIVACLELAKQYGGFGVLAHIELNSGFEKTIGRFGPQMDEIFKCKNLYGIEIGSKNSIDFYTDNDSDENRKRLIKLRRETLLFDENYTLPKLMSSDSHELTKLGMNADGNKRLTRIKMDELNFHSFEIALMSHESRIRLEDFIPEKRPIIKSITIEGGLLDKIQIDLSSNLTCIIGSRGAGKSTLLEAIRETSGNKSSSRVVDSEVWPQKIKLSYEDETGQLIEFSREKNNSTQNDTDPVSGISKVEIESYGQGETADTIQHSDTNPVVLINFLDSFLDVESLKTDDYELRNKLRENQSESLKLRLELLSLEETKKALLNEQKKLANLEKEKAGELVKFQNALIKERQIRSGLIKDLNDLVTSYRDILSNRDAFRNFSLLSDEEIIVGKDFFQNVKQLVSDFSQIVTQKSGELNIALNTKIGELKTELEKWAEKEKLIQTQIDDKKEELAKLGIPFDLGKINQISKDIIDLTNKVKKLELNQEKLKGLDEQRKELIKKRIDVKDKIYNKRYIFAETINQNLKNTLDGLYITVKYDKGKYSDAFESLLKSVMDWRTAQVPKASLISMQLSPLDFAEVCKKKQFSSLQLLKDGNGNKLLSATDIDAIISKVNNKYTYEDFECIEYEDRPTITITKLYTDDDGKIKTLTRSLSQLSLGQQQSVLLGILMLSKSKKPLIIDQPEDNLDSEFIFKTIVKNLRRIKEARQVIIVTHNPNIAVLGDAELIVPLKSTSVKSHMLHSGSIDRDETRKICCEILEGGQRAFQQRQLIYGI